MIAAERDNLAAKIDYVDKMISSAIAEVPQVQSLLSSTSDVWVPVITATADQRRGFAGTSVGREEIEKTSEGGTEIGRQRSKPAH